jgi:hypothetical protein
MFTGRNGKPSFPIPEKRGRRRRIASKNGVLEVQFLRISTETEKHGDLVMKLMLERRQLFHIPIVAFRVGRLLHFDDDEVFIGSTVVDDDVGEDRFGVKIVTSDVVSWRQIQSFRVVTVPVVFAVHVPLREFSLQVLCKFMRDAALVEIACKQVAVEL